MRTHTQTSSIAVSVPITVEFEDVDSFGIVHYVKYIAYLERARMRLLSRLGFDIASCPVAPVLYELSIRYRKPARLSEELIVEAWVEAVEELRIVLSYKVCRGSETLSLAKTVIAFADLGAGTLAPVPTALIEALSEGSSELLRTKKDSC